MELNKSESPIIVFCKSGKTGVYPGRLCVDCPDENWESLVCVCGQKDELSNIFNCWGDAKFYCKKCSDIKHAQIYQIMDNSKNVEEAVASIRNMLQPSL